MPNHTQTLAFLKNLRMNLNDCIYELEKSNDLESVFQKNDNTDQNYKNNNDDDKNSSDEEEDDNHEEIEEDDEEEYCPLCGIEIDVASNHWGGGKLPTGDFYCVPCYTDILEGRKTFPKGC